MPEALAAPPPTVVPPADLTDSLLEGVPPPAVVRKRLAEATSAVSLLRRLLKISEDRARLRGQAADRGGPSA